jgi:hypothetical protein
MSRNGGLILVYRQSVIDPALEQRVRDSGNGARGAAALLRDGVQCAAADVRSNPPAQDERIRERRLIIFRIADWSASGGWKAVR